MSGPWDISFDPSSEIELGDGVVITKRPTWLTTDLLASQISTERARDILDPYRWFISVTTNGDLTRDSELEADRMLNHAVLAVWNARPCGISFNTTILVERQKDWECVQIERARPAKSLEAHALCEHSAEDLDAARSLYEAIRSSASESSVRRALSVLNDALRSDSSVRYILMWIAMESLYGAESGESISYRIAQRAALLLGESASERNKLFDQVKQCYRIRSKLVHGRSLRKIKSEMQDDSMLWSEEILSRSLRKILLDPEIMDTFSSKKRDDYLDRLALS